MVINLANLNQDFLYRGTGSTYKDETLCVNLLKVCRFSSYIIIKTYFVLCRESFVVFGNRQERIGNKMVQELTLEAPYIFPLQILICFMYMMIQMNCNENGKTK